MTGSIYNKALEEACEELGLNKKQALLLLAGEEPTGLADCEEKEKATPPAKEVLA